MLRPSVLCCALGLLGLVATAHAQQKADDREGAEFIDMPEAPAPKAPEPELPADEKEAAGYVPGYRSVPSVGLSPYAPQMYSGLPGGVTPALGAPVPEGEGFRFDHHGYLQAPLRVGIGHRETATSQQKKVTLHGDPVLPGGSYGWFDHTQTVPTPWAQVNFHYGNQYVMATAILGGWNLSQSMEAAGYFQPNARVLVNDAFLTFTPPKFSQLDFKVNVGAYNDRYGAMGEYDGGRYGVPLIAQIAGVGATITARWPLAQSLALNFEAGFKGDLNSAPTGIPPNGSNEHAKELEGSTYTEHVHVGATLFESVEPTLHFISSFAQDDRGDPPDDPETSMNESFLKPDGRLNVYGADLRVKGGRHGHFYVGFAHTVGQNVLSLSDQTQVLYTGSGNLFMDRFWGYESEGNGTLSVGGVEYTLSLGTLLRYPNEFWGEGPDLIVSLFGIGAHVTSEQAEFDNKDMLKYGTEVTYSIASWFAMSGRFDHVQPDLDNPSRSFAVLSPKLIFRTDWKTREALTLQYAGYFLGEDVRVEGDDRLFNNPSGDPDSHLIAISGTMWW